MRINKSNYEQYLVDYLDGKLTPVEVSEVLLFLELHPDIRAEFDGIEKISVKENDPVPFDLSSLKRPGYADVKSDYENMLIAELEGDLTIEEHITLKQVKQLYPELEKDATQFSHTVLAPEEVVFEHKRSLKKYTIIPLYNQAWVRVAAILLVVSLGGVLWFRNNPVSVPDQISMTTDRPSAEGKKSVSRSGGTGNVVEGTKIPQKAKSSSDEVNIPQTITVARTSSMVKRHQTQREFIEPKASASSETAFTAPRLPYINHYLSYPVSAGHPGTEDFVDVKLLALQEIGKKKERLLGKDKDGKTLTLLQAINKATGDNVKVDTNEAGRIRRFEIAGLGFEWSQSK